MIGSVPLALYRGATHVFAWAAPTFLRGRARRGKEDAARLGERLGHAGRPRPPGPLAWLHGASVGEGLALLPLIQALSARGFQVLVTTGTVTSSRVVATRLPAGAVHQFVPLDLPAAAARFFDHWRPDLVGFAESELWPNLLGEAARRGVPTILVNGRMSARSFARWRKAPAVIRPLLGRFDAILAQSAEDASRFSTLGGRAVSDAGNLKFDVPPPAADPETLGLLQDKVQGRPLWVAASTHGGEEAICIAAHRALVAAFPDLLSIIVPRQADRGPAIAADAEAAGLRASLRSAGRVPERTDAIHVADTMGDLGLFYRLAPVVFVGKSLTPDGGGQNPIEPAKLGSAILHGPHVANFVATYAALDDAGGGTTVETKEGLVAALGALLADPDAGTRMAARAGVFAATSGGATARIMAAIEPICASIITRRAP